MKKFSEPPMIIILDILFIFLFVLVLESSPNIKIVLPDNKWINDAIIVSLDKKNAVKHWYNKNVNSWEDIKTFPKAKRKFAFIVGNIKCNKYKFCQNIPALPNEKKEIYIKGNLYDEVSGLITDSCLKFPSECSNVTYHIKENGEVDLARLKKDYKFFKYILK